MLSLCNYLIVISLKGFLNEPWLYSLNHFNLDFLKISTRLSASSNVPEIEGLGLLRRLEASKEGIKLIGFLDSSRISERAFSCYFLALSS